MSSEQITPGRRGLLRGAAAIAGLGLGGCGFRPLYSDAPAAAGGDPTISAEFSATRVGLIPERFGQLLRRGLQRRLGADGGAAPGARWELLVGPALSADAIGILRDGSATRVRYIATANWTLLRLAPREAVANGFERVIDAFNIQPNQYFAADASREATERRMADALADEVVTRLAIRFRGLRDGAAPALIEPVAPPPGLAEPSLGGAGSLVPPASGGEAGGLGGGIGPAGTLR